MPNPTQTQQGRNYGTGGGGSGGLSTEEIKKILSGDGPTIAASAERLAGELKDLKSAQIRNFYGPVTKIRESHEAPEAKLNRLHLMRPRLAYMEARERNARPLRRDFERLIKEATAHDKSLDGLFDFAEAVVGYHKQHQK